ncbi:hypothetical protein CP8484711_0424, partial [Chlamydia psittaci 84-8471/1]
MVSPSRVRLEISTLLLSGSLSNS